MDNGRLFVPFTDTIRSFIHCNLQDLNIKVSFRRLNPRYNDLFGKKLCST